MSIQVFQAPDNRVPDKRRVTEPDMIIRAFKLLKNKKVWIGVVVLSVLYLLLGGTGFELIGFILITLVIISFFFAIASQFRLFKILKNSHKPSSFTQELHDYFKAHLTNQNKLSPEEMGINPGLLVLNTPEKQPIHQLGFNVDYEAVGILIDAKNKKIAFTIDPELRPQVTVCDFSDVVHWESYSQGVDQQNQYGARTTLLERWFVSVYIRDPDQPRRDFLAQNDVDADKWVARLDTLIN